MAKRIMVQPAEDYFVAFLATRGINLVSENPEVFYYFGDSKRKLKKLVATYDPDLVIVCNQKAFDLDYKFPFVLDSITNDHEIYLPKTVSTNAIELAMLNYRSLGINRSFHDCNAKKIEERKSKLKINSSPVKRVFAAMMWE